jgi:hypothetical protein
VTAAATGFVAIGNVAELAPALTITLAGTVAEALSLPSAIVAPPAGAVAVRLTVPVEFCPPVRTDGLAVSELSWGVPLGGL